jgi:hypothetical protein
MSVHCLALATGYHCFWITRRLDQKETDCLSNYIRRKQIALSASLVGDKLSQLLDKRML